MMGVPGTGNIPLDYVNQLSVFHGADHNCSCGGIGGNLRSQSVPPTIGLSVMFTMNNLARICRVFVVVVERGGIFGADKVQDGHGTGITRECTGLRMSDDSSRSRSCHDVDG